MSWWAETLICCAAGGLAGGICALLVGMIQR